MWVLWVKLAAGHSSDNFNSSASRRSDQGSSSRSRGSANEERIAAEVVEKSVSLRSWLLLPRSPSAFRSSSSRIARQERATAPTRLQKAGVQVEERAVRLCLHLVWLEEGTAKLCPRAQLRVSPLGRNSQRQRFRPFCLEALRHNFLPVCDGRSLRCLNHVGSLPVYQLGEAASISVDYMHT